MPLGRDPPAVGWPQLYCFRAPDSKVGICMLCWVFKQQVLMVPQKKNLFCKCCTGQHRRNILLSGGGTVLFGELLLNQPWACITTNTHSCLLSPLLILYKQVHWNRHNLWFWNIYMCGTTRFYCLIWDLKIPLFTMKSTIFLVSCHLFSWSKWNLGLGRLQKWPGPSTEPQTGVCCELVRVAAVDCTSD